MTIQRLNPAPNGKPQRFIDPNADPEVQYQQLQAFIMDPPENSRTLTITAALASLILDRINSRNRKQRPARIKRMMTDIKNNAWQFTGVPIIFGKSGILLDGQNRLAAVMRSGGSIRIAVHFGIDDRAFQVLDTNAVRSGNDTFKVAGIQHPEIVANAVRWLMLYDEGKPTDRGIQYGNPERLAFYERHVDEDQMKRAVKRTIAVKGIPAAALAAHLYMFENKNAKATAKFAADLAAMKGAAKALVTKFAALRKQNMGRIHEAQSNALIIIAWNSYRNGSRLTPSALNWNETKDYPTF
jgi:hypothetical protein